MHVSSLASNSQLIDPRDRSRNSSHSPETSCSINESESYEQGLTDRCTASACCSQEAWRLRLLRHSGNNGRGPVGAYTPRTYDKAERFIQTVLREWAYARAYQNYDQRSAELVNWLRGYNWHRPHGSLSANTPISRLGLPESSIARAHVPREEGKSLAQHRRTAPPRGRRHRR